MPIAAEQATETIRKYIETVWIQRKIESLKEFFTPQSKVYTPFGEIVGLEGIQNYIKKFFEAFPDLKLEILEIFSQNQKAAVNWRISGTCGNFFGIDGKQKKAAISGNTLYFLENNKVRETRMCGDVYGLLTQLGAIPSVFKKN